MSQQPRCQYAADLRSRDVKITGSSRTPPRSPDPGHLAVQACSGLVRTAPTLLPDRNRVGSLFTSLLSEGSATTAAASDHPAGDHQQAEPDDPGGKGLEEASSLAALGPATPGEEDPGDDGHHDQDDPEVVAAVTAAAREHWLARPAIASSRTAKACARLCAVASRRPSVFPPATAPSCGWHHGSGVDGMADPQERRDRSGAAPGRARLDRVPAIASASDPGAGLLHRRSPQRRESSEAIVV